MSIQSEIDRIKGEVNTQTAQIGTNAALIQQIKAALDGKAAGGGSGGFETCTVTVVSDELFISPQSAYIDVDSNGHPYVVTASLITDAPATVLCNSYITFANVTVISVESVDGTSRMGSSGRVFIGTSDTTITLRSGSANPWG